MTRYIGSPAAAPPAPPFLVSSPPSGGWCWFQDPRAVYDAAHTRTIYGYLDGSTGTVAARTIDDGTLAVSAQASVYPAFEKDDHDAPAFLVRASDGYICMGFTIHVGDIYFAVGASAGALPTGLGNVMNITSQVNAGPRVGSQGYTYAHLAQLSAEANTIYYFHRFTDSGGVQHVSYTKSTDNGATWAVTHGVCSLTYHKLAVNGSGRIDVAMSIHGDPAQENYAPHSIYHMYYSGGNWYQSDGTLISATQPFDYTNPTVVYDGSTTSGWIWDIAIDGSGNPVIVYATFPGNDGHDHVYNYATWNGSAWTNHEICDGGTSIQTTDFPPGQEQNFYSGGVYLDHGDASYVYLSKNTTGAFQLYRYHTTDGGATWTSTQLTSDANKNVRPITVLNAGSSVKALFLDGTYTTYVDYSQGTKGSA